MKDDDNTASRRSGLGSRLRRALGRLFVRDRKEADDPVVEPGRGDSQSLKVEPATDDRPVVDAQIGFDLGTSSSKVVIGFPDMEKSIPVVFRPDQSGVSRYLVPTSYRDTGTECQLVASGGGDRCNFKMRLMQAVAFGQVADAELQIDLVVYAALVLRRSMEWFGTQYQRDFGHLKLFWNLAVGFPGKKVTGPLASVYMECMVAAALLAGTGVTITRQNAKAALLGRLGRGGRETAIHPDSICLWPEIAAQLAGYMRSPYHRNGNIVLVDIGAGTVDISTLILHGRTEARVCSFHFCCVEPLGAHVLYEERRRALARYAVDGILAGDDLEGRDPMLPVPEQLDDFLAPGARLCQTARDGFAEATIGLSDRCIRAALAQLTRFRVAQRTAHQSDAFDPWPGRLPLILSGGGSRLEFYRRIFSTTLDDKLVPFTRWDRAAHDRRLKGQGLETIALPQPDDLDADTDIANDFDRLSVAHGLAFGVENLPEVTASTEADQIL